MRLPQQHNRVGMMDIRTLLISPESKSLAFKRDLSSPKSLLKTLVAFAITAGGTLIIGADDVIAQVFHRLEIMERWGSGWQRISEACNEGGYPEPEWQEPGMCTRVVFRPHPEVRANVPVNVPVNVGVNDAVNDAVNALGLNERQRWFIQQLQAGRNVNSEDIVRHWKIGIATAKRDIISLRKNALIEFIGAPKTGRYQLKVNQ